GSAKERHFVIAGVAARENAIFHVIQDLDDVVSAANLPSEFDDEPHASPILTGRGRWRKIPKNVRHKLVNDALGVLTGRSRSNLRVFAAVVEKSALPGDDIVTHAFEQIASRFNHYLKRIYRRNREPQRGLMIFDESRLESELQTLATIHRIAGTQWGNLRNLAEVPLFVDSKATRLIQLADLISYAFWRRFEHDDDELLKQFHSSVDSEGGVYHGLYHRRHPETNCECAACYRRR
ncbi:MAG: DUF3800 domain-containing protein, partial [Alphaproteobacteria bacterium]|nr:DUF3800 domain-containing protein [Alphaproteobacteria bacterium]